MTSADKLGMVVAVAVVIIFVGLGVGMSNVSEDNARPNIDQQRAVPITEDLMKPKVEPGIPVDTGSSDTTEICGDGIDNDGDLTIDNNDLDCDNQEVKDSNIDDVIKTEQEMLSVNNQSMRVEAREREERLREISIKLRTPSGLTKLEEEPAFRRNNVDLDDVSHSSEDDVSHYTLTDSEDDKIILKDNNSYLHDNVD